MTRNRSIGEMAAQCGLSPRSLRHLEEKGLISPKRSEAGRRVYGAQETSLVTRILLLRQVGYRLSEISSAMLHPSLDARSLIESQILCLNAKQKQVTLMLRRLHETLTLLETREALDVDGLCSLIKEAQTIMSDKDFKAVATTYFTEKEWSRWKETGSKLFPGDMRTRYEQDWAALIERIEKAIASGVMPSSSKALALMEEWRILQQPMVEALGKDHWNKAARMYGEMDQWETETAKAPFSQEVYHFVSETARLAREN
ncbi:MerR family DNA-binding transcriptional regulator [Asaia siamensis]|uniref:HTH merR-type domain-containing protein n=1 Tax=Asaia siamensis TaxID=110479 RepID=A0ABQ1LG43_9PROT|nr:MerR family DNA-binding transcriptional regulator [Asaia siamensis]GGC23271.1 hypothetical protein GCM10007207_05730 [Asaia siamensis]